MAGTIFLDRAIGPCYVWTMKFAKEIAVATQDGIDVAAKLRAESRTLTKFEQIKLAKSLWLSSETGLTYASRSAFVDAFCAAFVGA